MNGDNFREVSPVRASWVLSTWYSIPRSVPKAGPPKREWTPERRKAKSDQERHKACLRLGVSLFELDQIKRLRRSKRMKAYEALQVVLNSRPGAGK